VAKFAIMRSFLYKIKFGAADGNAFGFPVEGLSKRRQHPVFSKGVQAPGENLFSYSLVKQRHRVFSFLKEIYSEKAVGETSEKCTF
jgi:hypothetical protein